MFVTGDQAWLNMKPQFQNYSWSGMFRLLPLQGILSNIEVPLNSIGNSSVFCEIRFPGTPIHGIIKIFETASKK
jgi:hypothetical protein